MSGPILSVKFFHTDAGNEPVRDFLRDLPPEDRKIIGTDIKEVQFGWPLGMPLVRKMEKDLWEVRSHLERRIFRVYRDWRPNGVASCFYQEVAGYTTAGFRDSQDP
jgi:hypothetical protein